ncbi:phage portal protein [Georgenia sp. MJ206]|uniref:phage portal protein n=1 Tax=Georgenia wangjunii TaxID=3117730 RepID=UPI002F2620CF
MPLNDDELTLIRRLNRKLTAAERYTVLMDRYYEGEQRLEHIGLAVPPELRRFETVLNVPRVAVDEPERRLDVRALVLPGEDKSDDKLLELWTANNMDSQASLLHKDTMIYGRGFVSVGANEDDPDLPLIRVEPTDAMTCEINNRTRSMTSAFRLYKDESGKVVQATLYLPDKTIWLERERGRWVAVDSDDHGLGKVPVVLYLNRPRTGRWQGTSEMKDVIGLTDAIARTLTNMQLAGETAAIPHKVLFGATTQDFVDQNGKPIPVWEAYFTSLLGIKNPQGKIGEFSAANLSNFHDQVNSLFSWAAAVLGLPTRYAGQQTVNPAAEGAIRADESRLIKNTERKQSSLGDCHGWTMALASEIAGRPVDGNRVGCLWYDAGTPTYSQRADAIQKLAGGVPILSREGAWDEMGWSENRKKRERQYFDAQDRDPTFEDLADAVRGRAPVGA